jgi:peptidoglycan/xylan/chitin deacetylase (PgdA/CDA1 family)
MKPAWYVILYHNVSWEDSAFTRRLDAYTHPPDLLFDHLRALSRAGRLVGVDEGLERASTGDLREPLFSIWFDDGMASVRRYARPILDQFQATAAMSVCSQFLLRAELHWRFKLSFLSHIDGVRFLRGRLRKQGFQSGMTVKDFSMDHFSPAVAQIVDEVFEELAPEAVRRDAFRLFEDRAGLGVLRDAGWVVANHSAAHHPVGEEGRGEDFGRQFTECETVLQELLGAPTRYWVVPFDRGLQRSSSILDDFRRSGGERHLVLVGSRVNRQQNLQEQIVYRIQAPVADGDALLALLRRS